VLGFACARAPRGRLRGQVGVVVIGLLAPKCRGRRPAGASPKPKDEKPAGGGGGHAHGGGMGGGDF